MAGSIFTPSPTENPEEPNESRVKSSTGSSPSQGWFESDGAYDIRVRKEANEQILKSSTGSSPSQGFFEDDHEYRSRIAREAREARAEGRQTNSSTSCSGSSGSSYDYSATYDNTSNANPISVFFKVIGGFIAFTLLLSMCNSKSNSPTPAKENFQQQHQSVKKAKKARKARKHIDEPVAGEALRDPSPSYSPPQVIEELKPAGNVRTTRTADVDPSGL